MFTPLIPVMASVYAIDEIQLVILVNDNSRRNVKAGNPSTEKYLSNSFFSDVHSGKASGHLVKWSHRSADT